MFKSMAPIYTAYIPALPTSAAYTPIVVKLERYSVQPGAQPATLAFTLPKTAVNGLSCCGNAIYVFRTDKTGSVQSEIFAGTIVEDDGMFARGSQDFACLALDMRHELNSKIIGQYGIGLVTTYGGWPGIGFDVIFNRDGKPNRSASPSVLPVSTGLYAFDTTDAAQYWTFANILTFLFYWFVDADVMRLDQSLLLGPYAENAPEIDLRNVPAGRAIDAVTRVMGGTWFPYYDALYAGPVAPANYAPTYFPLHAMLGPSNTRTLFVDDGKNLYEPTDYACDGIGIRHRAADSYDRLEIMSAPARVEATYSDTGTSPLLTKVSSGSELPDSDICYYDVDVTKYLANGLGQNLDAGSRPKKWNGMLCTRLDSSGYITGPLTEADEGTDIPATECVQISLDSGSTWQRVRSGVKLDLDKMRVHVGRKCSAYGSIKAAPPMTLPITEATPIRLKLTITTILEYPIVSETDNASWYLSRPRTRRILRRDFVPLYRINSEVPDLTSSNPNTFTMLASGSTVTAYRDPTSDMEAFRDRIFAARNELEVDFNCTLPTAPEIQLGDAVTTWPLSLWTTTQPVRVMRLDFDPDSIDIKIQATNNIDGDYA